LPGRDATKPDGGEQAQRRRIGLFRLKKDARYAALLQPVHASQEQRSPESAPLVRWARPDHPDLAEGVFAATIGHLGEFTEAKRYKRSGGIDRDQVQVGFLGGGPVIVQPHADPVEYCLVELLVRLQFLPMHTTTKDKARWRVGHR